MWPSAHAQSSPIIPAGGAAGQIYLTDLKFTPKKITLSWNNDFANSPLSAPGTDPDTDPTAPTRVEVALVWDTLYRTPSGSAVSTVGDWTNVITSSGTYCSSGTSTWTDTDWSLDTQYTYYLTGGDVYWQWIAGSGSTPGSWVLQSSPVTGDPYCVTVRKTAVSANQTVDTRVDPRYDVPPLKNYPFAASLYRGGLFSGYNADGSQVARTYLKFTGLAGPIASGQQLWAVGGIWVYATRLSKTGSASVTCTSVPDNTWDPTTLVWGNAPAPNGYGCGPVSVSWDSTNPVEQWVELPVVPAIEHAMTATSGTLSLVIRAADESGSGTGTMASAGWTYWARNSYHEPASTTMWTGTLGDGQFHPGGSAGLDLSAYLLYAYGGSGAVALQSLTFSPTSIPSLSSSTGAVLLTYPAPAGGLTVTLTSSDSSVLSCPATLTIPGGQTFATFYVTSGSVTSTQIATITATFDDSMASGNVTVTTGSGGTGTGGTGTGGGGGTGTGGTGTGGTGGGGTGGGGTGGGGTGGPPGGGGGTGGPPGP